MSEKLLMRKPDGSLRRQDVEVGKREKIGEGSEVETSRVELHYSKYERTINGLVLKKLHHSELQPTWAEHQVDDIMQMEMDSRHYTKKT